MNISKLGIDPSVAGEDPIKKLQAELSNYRPSVEVLEENSSLDTFDAVVTTVHRDAFLSSNLQWIHLNSAGVDHIPLSSYEDRGIAVTNSHSIHRTAVGEHALGMMLMLAHRLLHFTNQKSNREWNRPDWNEKFRLRDETVCVVGLGALGKGVAERVGALGMEVTGVRRTPEELSFVETIYQADQLHEAISDQRFVVLTVPLTESTRHMIGSTEFAVMNDDSYLINVSRGEVVDEDTLITALKDEQIAGAGLDVFRDEPLPEDSPIWDIENVVFSPHCAGSFIYHYLAVADQMRENLDRIAADEELLNRVV